MATGLLPDDLLLEILVRLPVQSLLGFSLLSIFESVIWFGRLCLWVMKDYGMEESWVKQFVIECPAILRSLRRNGNVILENIRGRLTSYNHKTNQIEDSEIPIEGSVQGFHIKSYLKSLVLLDRRDAQLVLQERLDNH